MKLNLSLVALLTAISLSVVSGCSNGSPDKMQSKTNMMGMESAKMDNNMSNSMSSKSEEASTGEMQPKMEGKMTAEMQPKMDAKMTPPIAGSAK